MSFYSRVHVQNFDELNYPDPEPEPEATHEPVECICGQMTDYRSGLCPGCEEHTWTRG